MIAFNGSAETKQFYIDRVEAHRLADSILQGFGYWKDGKGCAVGCSIHGEDHSQYETLLGTPRSVAGAEDELFESMSVERARLWPTQFFEAIPVGADLSRVVDELRSWLLELPAFLDGLDGEGRAVAAELVPLMQRRLAGDEPSDKEWDEADIWDDFGLQRLTTFSLYEMIGQHRDADHEELAETVADKLLELMGAATVPAAAR